MRAITIPKALSRKGDLVIIPRKEYETLLELKKVKEFQPTAAHRKALSEAMRNLKRGKTLSYHAFVRELSAS